VDEEKILEEARIDKIEATIRNLASKSTQMFFDISITGTIGTVNGLRLGRVDRYIPPAAEINAAFGHVVLLVELIMHRVKHKVNQEYSWAGPFIASYRIRALGSKSRIENRKDKQTLPLYFSGTGTGWRLHTWFTESDYDRGLEIFLQCLNELYEYAQRHSPDHWQKRTISIFGDKIECNSPKLGPYSIRYNSSSMENWTAALKMMLDLTKQLLNWFDKNKKTWT